MLRYACCIILILDIVRLKIPFTGLDFLDPYPKKPICNNKTPVVPINHIFIQKRFQNSLDIGSRTESISADKIRRKRFYNTQFIGQSFQKPPLIQREGFPQGRVCITFPLKQGLDCILDQVVCYAGIFFA